MPSALLTAAIVEQAIDILYAGVADLIHIRERVVARIVVLDPTTPQECVSLPVLWEGGIGEEDSTKWPKPYSEYALRKAELTWKTKLPSHLVQRNNPYLFENDDFKYGGSEYREGIIVATSGLAWHDDYLVSASLAAMLHAMTIGAFEEELKKESYFIGG